MHRIPSWTTSWENCFLYLNFHIKFCCNEQFELVKNCFQNHFFLKSSFGKYCQSDLMSSIFCIFFFYYNDICEAAKFVAAIQFSLSPSHAMIVRGRTLKLFLVCSAYSTRDEKIEEYPTDAWDLNSTVLFFPYNFQSWWRLRTIFYTVFAVKVWLNCIGISRPQPPFRSLFFKKRGQAFTFPWRIVT